jgi:hypothetical protein
MSTVVVNGDGVAGEDCLKGRGPVGWLSMGSSLIYGMVMILKW